MKLEVRSARCGYPGGAAILENVSFTVETGEICCLLGPNGVGKTTLFKSLLGLLKLQGGEIRIDGEDISHWSPRRMARTAAAPRAAQHRRNPVSGAPSPHSRKTGTRGRHSRHRGARLLNSPVLAHTGCPGQK